MRNREERNRGEKRGEDVPSDGDRRVLLEDRFLEDVVDGHSKRVTQQTHGALELLAFERQIFESNLL